MAQSDKAALDANYANWLSERAEGFTEVSPWLFYCIEQFAKSWGLADDDIISSITDGPDDGGADAIFIFANQGTLVRDPSQIEPKAVSKLRIIFFQVRKSGGFAANEVAKHVPLADDFFDIGKKADQFVSVYNSAVRAAMRTFKETYRKILGDFPEVTVDYYYVTGDDMPSPDTKCLKSEAQVAVKVAGHLGASVKPNWHYAGAAQLGDQARRKPSPSKTLTYAMTPAQAPNGFIGLVTLPNFVAFIQESPGVRSETIFENNVRGFLSNAAVNEKIRGSLNNPSSDVDFWQLNNGITVLTTSVGLAGQYSYTVQNPQIVNGQQTSREIFDYLKPDKVEQEKRHVLVRLIITKDADVMNEIIAATNSQNKMDHYSLRMTDKIHGKIEDVFRQLGLFYDRRKGFHKDQGRPIVKIVSATELIQAAIAILLQRPDDARARPGDYFKDDHKYKLVYGDDAFPLKAFYECVQIVRAVKGFLAKSGLETSDQKNLVFYIASDIACDIAHSIDPGDDKVVPSLLAGSITDSMLATSFNRIRKVYKRLEGKSDGDTVARGPDLLKRIRAQQLKRYGQKERASETA